jgi:DNA replication and repair protein RecF
LPELLAGTTFEGVFSVLAAGPAVRLIALRLTGFRNLAPIELEIPGRGLVLEGANGQGKTNFLEAIHFLARFRSFRGAPITDAIAFGAEHFRVEGTVAIEDGSERAVAVAADRSGRRIALDGRGATPARALGTLLAVLVAPDDHALIAGSPSRRRAYLDGVLAVASRRYRRSLRDFERSLKQRNEALRREAPEAVLATWDEALVEAGVGLFLARAAFVARQAARFAELAGAIAGCGERGDYELAYAPSVAEVLEADDDRVASAWRRALVADRVADRRRGWTGVGPHRDDLAIGLGGRPLGRYGSQGEHRTAAVALRLLEADVLEEEVGSRPILLLDDVFSELDEERGRRLLERLDAGARRQRFVTTPRPLAWVDGATPRWRVVAGAFDRRPAHEAPVVLSLARGGGG